jgi:epoxyqueuosine reductase
LRARAEHEFLSKAVKKVARFLGADLVGVARYDERWVYSHLYRRDAEEGSKEVVAEMADDAPAVVVLAFEKDREVLDTSPTALAMAAATVGYSRMAFIAPSLSELIRGFGRGGQAGLAHHQGVWLTDAPVENPHQHAPGY